MIALFGAVLIGVPAIIDANNAPEVSEVIGVKPSDRAPAFATNTEHLYVPPAPVVEVVAPVVETYEEPSYSPTLCPPGTVANAVDANGNESNCQTPCNMWSDLDGDGIAETCTAAPYEGRRFNEV